MAERLSDEELAAYEENLDSVAGRRLVADLRAERELVRLRDEEIDGWKHGLEACGDREERLEDALDAERVVTARLRALARAVSDTWGPWPEGFQPQEFVAALKALQVALAESEGTGHTTRPSRFIP